VGVAAAFSILIPSGGFRQAFRRPSDRAQLFTAVFALTPLSVFVAFSLFHQVKLNWTGPLWLALLPALAQMIATGRHLALFRRAPAWGATIAILLPLYGAGLHYLALGLPGIPYPGNLQGVPVAWREFGDAAGEIERQAALTAGQEPLLVGMDRYALASELAFYGRHDGDSIRNTAGRGLFGLNSLMFNRWFSTARQTGRTVIMFGFKPGHLSDGLLAGWFQELGPVAERTVYKAGSPVGRFFYRVGYGFRLPVEPPVSLRELASPCCDDLEHRG
jgi:dolichol-phosphate mannosyltransferase